MPTDIGKADIQKMQEQWKYKCLSSEDFEPQRVFKSMCNLNPR